MVSGAFEVACEELRAAAKKTDECAALMSNIQKDMPGLELGPTDFGGMPATADVAATYSKALARLTDVVKSGTDHLYEVGDGLFQVAQHYEDQDAASTTDFHF